MTLRARVRAVFRPGAPVLVPLIIMAAALITSCGAPEYTYVTNSTDKTYLKVPSTWRQVDQKALDTAVGLDPARSAKERGAWAQAFDAAEAPSPDHVFGSDAAVPAVLIAVQQNSTTVQGKVSLDGMRDFFYPVSPGGRQMAAMSGQNLTNFQLMADEVLTPGDGLRGVHDVFRYSINGGPPQVFDQTVYVNDDASKLYIFFVRCSAECYELRKGEITAVAKSFTVRETP